MLQAPADTVPAGMAVAHFEVDRDSAIDRARPGEGDGTVSSGVDEKRALGAAWSRLSPNL